MWYSTLLRWITPPNIAGCTITAHLVWMKGYRPFLQRRCQKMRPLWWWWWTSSETNRPGSLQLACWHWLRLYNAKGECEDGFENVRVLLESACAAEFPEHKCSDWVYTCVCPAWMNLGEWKALSMECERRYINTLPTVPPYSHTHCWRHSTLH